ncbi:hypothetical protein [Paraburkholderia phosphatilytica]|nr:hypothetical protein [Paraburkholderia phosphatilytica]
MLARLAAPGVGGGFPVRLGHLSLSMKILFLGICDSSFTINFPFV